MTRILCLDTSVIVKYLVTVEFHPDAVAMVVEACNLLSQMSGLFVL